MAKRVEKVLSCQEHLDIKDPQVELHLLRSCLGLCKINHILRTVLYHLIESTRKCTSLILVCAIAWNRYPTRSFLIVLGGKQPCLLVYVHGLGLREELLHQMLLLLEALTVLVSLLVNCLPIHLLYLLGQKLLSLLVIMLSQVSLFLEKFNVETGCNLSFLPTVHVIWKRTHNMTSSLCMTLIYNEVC